MRLFKYIHKKRQENHANEAIRYEKNDHILTLFFRIKRQLGYNSVNDNVLALAKMYQTGHHWGRSPVTSNRQR